MNPWKHTHTIRAAGESIRVMLFETGLYTQDEWEQAEAYDWSVVDGVLLFHGSPVHPVIEGATLRAH